MSNEAKVMLAIVFLLLAVGLVMTYSASAVFADAQYHDMGYFLNRKGISTALGVLVLAFMSRVNVRWLQNHSRQLVLVGIALLATVYIPFIGVVAGGARRWITLGFFKLQPAEVVKVIACIYLSDYLIRKRREIRAGAPWVFVPPMIVLVIFSSMILVQPDLGSVFVLVAIASLLFFLSGIAGRYVGVLAAAAVPFIYFFVYRVPYRWQRVLSFIDPWRDAQGSGFQVIQSFLSYALGGWHGLGLGRSIQKLFYLPQSYTDFIFAIVGEELGLVGTLAVLALFAAFFVVATRIARRARSPFGMLLGYSLVLLITLQAILNMLVATGMVPTKGLPLPFVSYGGSNVVVNLAAVGLILALDRTRRA